MSATQVSFTAFALAAQQAALESTPPALDAAGSVVAHQPVAGGGECPATAALDAAYDFVQLALKAAHPLSSEPWACPDSDFVEFNRLLSLADETIEVPFRSWSRGGYLLAALANLKAPFGSGEFFGCSEHLALVDNLRSHAARCIGAGC